MRRKDREMTDRGMIEEVMRRAMVCRMAMCEGDRPYVVPVCFGYEDGAVYIHCATEGKKLDVLRKNPNVCVEFEVDTELVVQGEGCHCTMKYRSVIGSGRASLVEDTGLKRKGLDAIMKHYTGRTHEYPDEMVNRTAIIRVEIESLTGKQSGY